MLSDTPIKAPLETQSNQKYSPVGRIRRWFACQASSASHMFLFFTFLRIGSVSFGGFMSLIAFIETIIVKRYRLISHEEMLDAISLANLLPGPQAVNVVAYVGHKLRGTSGAIISMFAVLLPSFLLILAISYVYFKYGDIPALQKAFQGFMPAIAAIVLSVVWRMGMKTIKGRKEILILVASVVLMVTAPLEQRIYAPVLIIALSALVGYVFFRNSKKTTALEVKEKFPFKQVMVPLIFLAALATLWFIPLPLANNSLLLLVITFASMSLMLFGGGYVFIPIIGSVVVLQYGWVTQQEFTDGIAMGQITPGPILISAAFIGYKVHGLVGALLATIAIYTPPAILMLASSRVLAYIKQSATTQATIHGVHCGVIGLILVAAFLLLHFAFPNWPVDVNQDWPTLLIFVLSLLALFKFKLDLIWIIPTAGLLGYMLY